MSKAVKSLAAAAGLLVAAFDVHVVQVDGFWSLLPPFASLHEYQVFTDMVIGLGLCCVWMLVDARKARRAAVGWLFVGVTLLLGSLGPLAYLALGWRPNADR